MILHILAHFKTHLKLYDEEIVCHPDQYAMFWDLAKKEIKTKDYGFKSISLHHGSSQKGKALNRCRDIDQNLLEKPIEIISFEADPNDEMVKQLFLDVKDGLLSDIPSAKELELISESIVVRLFNNSIAILDLDIKINDFIDDENKVAEDLDLLQEFGITLGEKLSQNLYKDRIEPFLRDLLSFPNATQFIIPDLFKFESAKSNRIFVLESNPNNYLIRVYWVNRALLFESSNERYSNKIIRHWLKNSDDNKMIEEVIANDNKCAYRWVNYLFREASYARSYNSDNTINYSVPFNEIWEALIISHYYYNAFEALNDSLHLTLATTFLTYRRKHKENSHKLKIIHRKLEREIIDAHELLIEYENNFAYYKRDIGNHIKDIMYGWNSENSIMNQVRTKLELCEQRMNVLHMKATEKSNLYTDLLLLSIAVISIIAFMFQVIEYGRNISHNADLAVYESNSINFVKLLSERPTDFAITISLGLMVVIFLFYYIFRKGKVLD